jgi:2-amino-4-hydroxy-6-hydroxymethyldihydropteridine diphosphokinase
MGSGSGQVAKAYIGLGSNLGNRRANVEAALDCLNHPGETRVLRVSKLTETDPVGGPPQPRFLNGVAEIETELAPEALLEKLLAIEEKLGRVRREKWGPRVIDLDLLFYDDRVIDSPELKLPHPLIVQRTFVLQPLAELAPDLVHPETGKTIREHLKLLESKSSIG